MAILKYLGFVLIFTALILFIAIGTETFDKSALLLVFSIVLVVTIFALSLIHLFKLKGERKDKAYKYLWWLLVGIVLLTILYVVVYYLAGIFSIRFGP